MPKKKSNILDWLAGLWGYIPPKIRGWIGLVASALLVSCGIIGLIALVSFFPGSVVAAVLGGAFLTSCAVLGIGAMYLTSQLERGVQAGKEREQHEQRQKERRGKERRRHNEPIVARERVSERQMVDNLSLAYDAYQAQHPCSFNVSNYHDDMSSIEQLTDHNISLGGEEDVESIPDDSVIRGQNLRDRVRGTNLYDWRQKVRGESLDQDDRRNV